MKGPSAPREQCCLCGKTKEQVRKLIVGLHGAVCSDCIELCNDILHQRNGPQTIAAPGTWDGSMIIDSRLRGVFLSPAAVDEALSTIAGLILAYTANAAESEPEP